MGMVEPEGVSRKSVAFYLAKKGWLPPNFLKYHRPFYKVRTVGSILVLQYLEVTSSTVTKNRPYLSVPKHSTTAAAVIQTSPNL